MVRRHVDNVKIRSSILLGPILKNRRQNRGSNPHFGPDSGSQEKAGSGLDFQDFLKQATELSNTISKNKLEQLRTIVTRAHEKRFKRRKEPRYGSINKGFTELELQLFLRNVHNDKFVLLFRYQAYLGQNKIINICPLRYLCRLQRC